MSGLYADMFCVILFCSCGADASIKFQDKRSMSESNLLACTPKLLVPEGFNPHASLPYGLTPKHAKLAMEGWIDFLGFMNRQLHGKGIDRIETLLMPANFSSMVGEFMVSSIPKYCDTIVKNRYHNGHPDLIPRGQFLNDAVQHTDQGIEVKGSHYLKGWQGHNPEDCFLLVFVFDSNRPVDASRNVPPKPFKFLMVAGARLVKEDWVFSGRTGESRRTITASVANSGYQKVVNNWVYKDTDLQPENRRASL